CFPSCNECLGTSKRGRFTGWVADRGRRHGEGRGRPAPSSRLVFYPSANWSPSGERFVAAIKGLIPDFARNSGPQPTVLEGGPSRASARARNTVASDWRCSGGSVGATAA